ncbi:MAG: chemotaxis protein CheX [Acidobacteria bacterium]|nr:chemotaxis protein CheX [Acidobacteriota bacterium]
MEQALYQAAILTFEELGFIFPIERPSDDECENEESTRVSVKFNGSVSGEIVLQVENTILPTIASNMLGTEEPLEDEEILQDVLGELANVICGNTLPSIAGKNEVFRLEPPRKINKLEAGEKPAAIAHLDVEESRADVLLYLN